MAANLLKRIIKSHKRGAVHSLEVVLVMSILVFFMLIPVAYYILITGYMTINSVYNTVIQGVSIAGGVTPEVETLLHRNLVYRGLLPVDSTPAGTIEVVAGELATGQPSTPVRLSYTGVDGSDVIYRTYGGTDSLITVRLEVEVTGARRFLSAVLTLVGVRDSTSSDGSYSVVQGCIFSQLPKPVS